MIFGKSSISNFQFSFNFHLMNFQTRLSLVYFFIESLVFDWKLQNWNLEIVAPKGGA